MEDQVIRINELDRRVQAVEVLVAVKTKDSEYMHDRLDTISKKVDRLFWLISGVVIIAGMRWFITGGAGV